jgi:uncharacterized LabA/DUF88 family protein
MALEPAVKNAMAFFDVQNLFQHAKAAFGNHHPNFDPIKLHRAVCHANGWRPTLTNFYTGVPSRQEAPMWHAYWSNRVLALKRAGVRVETRPLRYRQQTIEQSDGSTKVVTTAQEKGIDVRIALDVVSMARKRKFDVALIFTQDQDLQELAAEIKDIAIEQNRWIKIVCAFPDGPNASYRRGVPGTDWFRMDDAFYQACIDPRDYRPAER